MAEEAMSSALSAFEKWKKVTPEERARYLFKGAAIMRRQKFELSAVLVLEAGKNWVEADAEVAEAIDFLEFYGREALRLAEPQPLTRLPGISCREPLFQPQVYRRDGRSPAFRRLQYVGHLRQGGRERLPALIQPGQSGD